MTAEDVARRAGATGSGDDVGAEHPGGLAGEAQPRSRDDAATTPRTEEADVEPSGRIGPTADQEDVRRAHERRSDETRTGEPPAHERGERA